MAGRNQGSGHPPSGVRGSLSIDEGAGFKAQLPTQDQEQPGGHVTPAQGLAAGAQLARQHTESSRSRGGETPGDDRRPNPPESGTQARKA